jgi:2-iminobutanoate/2-iminopropanoate deaminase
MLTAVRTPNAPTPLARYNQAIVAGNLVFISAMIGQDVVTGKFMTDNIDEETTQVLENIKTILGAAGTDFSHVVKVSIFLKDMNDYARVNEIYARYVTDPYPARETFQVGGLPLNVNIEIAAIAALS